MIGCIMFSTPKRTSNEDETKGEVVQVHDDTTEGALPRSTTPLPLRPASSTNHYLKHTSTHLIFSTCDAMPCY